MQLDTARLARCLRAVLGAIAAAACCLVAAPACAQADDEPRALTGVLKRIKDTRVVRLGAREGAVPFSSINSSGQASGYSIDICLAIVDDLAAAIGATSLRVEYRRVTPADRIEQVVDGRIDLECGATTNTVERRERVAFSPLTFLAGTRLLVKRGSPVRSLNDLAGRSVVVVRGTTNEEVIRRLATDSRRQITLLVDNGYAGALARVASGEVAALAADDILLTGYLAERRLQREYSIVGDLLSYEPYGVMFARNDRALADVVNVTFARLAASGEIRSMYNKWFVRTLPSGVRLGLPMGERLERSFEVLGLPPE
jgi:glutamate/aspartate transport system substrate-binding protein